MVALSSVLFYYYSKIERINEVENRVEQLLVEAVNVMAADEQFIREDFKNLDFFGEEKSYYLSLRDSSFKNIDRQIIQLQKEESNSEIIKAYNDIIKALNKYHDLYNKVLEIYKKRGFVDHGKEGEIRDLAHILEDSSELGVKKEWILTFRRHEKDYILRKDSMYIEKFENHYTNVRAELIKAQGNSGTVKLLDEYHDGFLELVELEHQLGLEDGTGLKSQLFARKVEAFDSFQVLGNMVIQLSKDVSQNARLYFLVASLTAIILAIIVSVIISRTFSRPIKDLSQSIDDFVYKDWNADLKIKDNIKIDELDALSKSYKKLIKQLKDQFEETKTKSEELDIQNGKLLKLGEEMDNFLSSASRKLRAPLNSLQGVTELVKVGKLKIDDKQTLSLMEEAFSQIENYLQEINDFVELRKEDIGIEEIPVRNLINEIVSDKKRKSTVPVNVNLEIDLEVSVKSDLSRLKLVLNHILENAFTYYDREIARLNILIDCEENDKELIIQIQDDGVGIAEDQLSNVFGMFYRASHLSKGTGLGLYIAKSSLKPLGGRIELSSKTGEGTLVKIILPRI